MKALSLTAAGPEGHLLAGVRGRIGHVVLNRPEALNALTLGMIRDFTAVLLRWRADLDVAAVVVQGVPRPGKTPSFCAGGDIRFLRQAALDGDPRLQDFFTEEYTLNHLIHTYGKPIIALMDGICFGGGMGVTQGAALRVVTQHSRLAMPETNIGLFPDVGGGWFLSRCPGRLGEYLALTGDTVDSADAIMAGLADVFIRSEQLPALVEALTDQPIENGAQALATVRARAETPELSALERRRELIDRHFEAPTVQAIAESLARDDSPDAAELLATLRKRSPLMMAVTLEHVRRARNMSLADDLRMERDIVRHSFHQRPAAQSEVVEGVRALIIDKNGSPRWNPARIEDVTPQMVQPFFVSPWPAHAHPLRML